MVFYSSLILRLHWPQVAVQCLQEIFHIDKADENQIKSLSIKPLTLQALFNTFLQTRSKLKQEKSSKSPDSTTEDTLAQKKAAADKLKAEGNTKLSANDLTGAISCYTKAIELCSTNAIYFSNRAAAYSKNGEIELAIADCEAALNIDPNYAKAYSRLG